MDCNVIGSPQSPDRGKPKGERHASASDDIGTQTKKVIGDNAEPETKDVIGDNVGSKTKDVTGDNVGSKTKDVTGDNVGSKTKDVTADSVGSETKELIGDNVETDTKDVTGDNVGSKTKDVTGDNLGSETKDVTGDNVESETKDMIGDNVGSMAKDATGDNVGSKTKQIVGDITGVEVQGASNKESDSLIKDQGGDNHNPVFDHRDSSPLTNIIPAGILVDCPYSVITLFLDTSCGLAEAESAKQHHQHQKALTLYRKHLHGLIQMLKYHHSEISKVSGLQKAITEKTHEHLTNAEECKREVEPQRCRSSGARTPLSRQGLEARFSGVSPSPNELGIMVVQNVPGQFDEIRGLNKAKEILKEHVILPLKFPFMIRQKYRTLILMFGAPGTGKTLLARSLASVLSEGQVLLVQCSDFHSRYLPDKERRLQQIFYFTESQGPCVLILDEIECLLSSSSDAEHVRRLKTEVFSQLCTGNKRNCSMYIIGLTSRPMMLPRELLRMVTKFIYVCLPDKEARTRLLQQKLKECPHGVTDMQLETLARRTEGYSGSDLEVLYRDVLMTPVREIASATSFKQRDDGKYEVCCTEDPQAKHVTFHELNADQLYVRPVSFRDFLDCLHNVKASVNNQDVQQHQEFIEYYYLQDYLYDQLIPASAPTLKNLCRNIILKHTKGGDLLELPLPQGLIRFLSPSY